MSAQKRKIKWQVYIPVFAITLIVIIAGILWYREYSKYISTDDAHIDSDNISLSAQILGRLNTLKVDEGDTVHTGDLLATLDSADLVAQHNQAIASLAQSTASKLQAEAKYQSDKEGLKILQIAMDKAQEDFNRAKAQLAGGVIAKEKYDHEQKALETAKAQIEAAQSQLEVSRASINSAEAAIGLAEAQIKTIETKLTNTKLYAPADGIVAKRWMLPGDVVQPGQAIVTINKSDKQWVSVYLEETKLSGLHLNQKTMFTVDAFEDVTFIGKVIQIGSNTASRFSLIPPNNASGNFTKVTQRVPVKISIESTENSGNINKFRLLDGMSAVVKIVKDR